MKSMGVNHNTMIQQFVANIVIQKSTTFLTSLDYSMNNTYLVCLCYFYIIAAIKQLFWTISEGSSSYR